MEQGYQRLSQLPTRASDAAVSAWHQDRYSATAYRRHLHLKRAFDILGSLVIVFVLLPLLTVISIAIVIESGFPILFLQKRPGKAGLLFTIYKFRTMHRNNKEIERQALHNDPRTTRVGKFLRRSSLDELPQLINVLLGHMSLVGPRPHPLWLDTKFTDRIKNYCHRTSMKPGITGLAQISGARGETKEDHEMELRVRLDLQYIEEWSLLLDLKILARTVFVIWVDKRAY